MAIKRTETGNFPPWWGPTAVREPTRNDSFKELIHANVYKGQRDKRVKDRSLKNVEVSGV